LWNTATGDSALFSNTTANGNVANGFESLLNNTTGNINVAVGWHALLSNTIGDHNTASGYEALRENISGDGNVGTGWQALVLNTTGAGNTADGGVSLNHNTTGNYNTAVGDHALHDNETGSYNIALGYSAGQNVLTADNVITIGANVLGADLSNSCFIGNIRGVSTANADAIPVLIDSAGQLGTLTSSKRFKKEIKPMNQNSEAILRLQPVTFEYKSDSKGTPQFGLIAEEVAKVNPDLVVRDRNGEIYSVRYEAVNAMLLNEFLKAHRKVEEQQATIAQLKSNAARQELINAQQQKGMEVLAAQLKEQAAVIQKVNDKVELNKPAPRTVATVPGRTD
jgi:Chaperone of endosialidase